MTDDQIGYRSNWTGYAARILQNAGHRITIFEALQGRGMDSHSLEFEGGLIDAPLRVMNPYLWKNTLSLATHLGIKTYPVRTYMACSWLFEDRVETWLTHHVARLAIFRLSITAKASSNMAGVWSKVCCSLKQLWQNSLNLKIRTSAWQNLSIVMRLKKCSGMVR